MTSYLTSERIMELTECPACGVGKNKRCLDPMGKIRKNNHRARSKDARNLISMKAPTRDIPRRKL